MKNFTDRKIKEAKDKQFNKKNHSLYLRFFILRLVFHPELAQEIILRKAGSKAYIPLADNSPAETAVAMSS